MSAPDATASLEAAPKRKRGPRGQGSVTLRENGQFWARAPGRSRTSLGFFDTREEADAALEAARRHMAVAEFGVQAPLDVTFAEFGAIVLDERERAGYRGNRSERAVWRAHLERSAFAQMPVARVTTAHVREFVRWLSRKVADDSRGPRLLAVGTIKKPLTVASAIFAAAIERGYRETNPCAGVKVKKRAGANATKDAFDWLRAHEQTALQTSPAIGEADRTIIMFAIGTGLRQGEQWNLEWRDLHVEDDAQGGPHVVVRFGSKGLPPKNGKIRRVPLFGVGLAAARRWIEIFPDFISTVRPSALDMPTRGRPVTDATTRALVFPGRRGSRRHCGQFHSYGHLDAVLKSCGVGRHLRWHDLRHTCASSLVSGIWGRRWTLAEVGAMLGHGDIQTTQRYAHLAESALTTAARETSGVVAKVQGQLSIEEMRRLVAEADAARLLDDPAA